MVSETELPADTDIHGFDKRLAVIAALDGTVRVLLICEIRCNDTFGNTADITGCYGFNGPSRHFLPFPKH